MLRSRKKQHIEPLQARSKNKQHVELLNNMLNYQDKKQGKKDILNY
jgi:hypothetical protein